ncbi:Replicative DNA helicase [Neolewinella maritima]|uniref:Replicative DNA helicase n=1 Tax=Neolewinella maritima TaxID=1383882 RepID=A0ABN8F1X1_9BACT|nr:replicative DNA helicase [Neolewinella maritima]CAH1000764.1 Replicative DNA helicase [Neolewinella maritima]
MAKDKQYDRRSGSGNGSTVAAYSNRNRLEEANLPSYSKLPPQAPDLEEAILSAILIEREAMTKVLDIIKPESFYKPAHQEIYRSMRRLFERSQPIDLLMVVEDLRKNETLEVVGGAGYLAQLTSRVTSSANIEYHARIVTEKFIQRELIRTSAEIIKDAYEDSTDVLDLLDKAGSNIFTITEENMGKQVADMGSLANQLLEQLTDLRSREGGLTGVATGFTELDRLTSGLQRSDLIIVAARPAMGKTSFVLSMARNAALGAKADKPTPVAIFSLEMSAAQLAGRIFSQDAEVNGQKMRNGKFTDDEWERLVNAMTHVGEAPIYIDDTPGINVFELRAKCRRLKLEKGIGMVIIDYLQLMSGAGEGNKGGNREQEVSAISRSLKGLAKELEVPVIALSQLSRAVETRGGDKRPQLSDLRESGCLTGDTLVTLAEDGRRVAIKELVARYPRGGFQVWATDDDYRLVPAMVSSAFSTGIKQTYRLTTKLGRSIRATANHKFLTIKGWKRLDELKDGEHIAMPRALPAGLATKVMSEAELALLGHLIGDGCTLPKHAIQYTTRENDLADIVSALTVKCFGDEVTPRTKQEGSKKTGAKWFQVYLSSNRKHTHGVRSAVSEWLAALGVWGLRSHEKHVPDRVFQQSQSRIALFLRHLWATDGCIKLVGGKKPYPAVYYASSSERLAKDVQHLLLNVGITARIKCVDQALKGRDQYHVIVTGQHDLLRFIDQVGAVGAYKSSALADIVDYLATRTANTNRDVIPKEVWHDEVIPSMQLLGVTTREMQATIGTQYCGSTLYKSNLSRDRARTVASAVDSLYLNTLSTSDVYWDQIGSIIPDATEEVFDLTVPGPHNFVADGIVVHNSIEQDADMVMFLYRPEYYKITEDEQGNSLAGVAEIIVGKNRHGEARDIRLRFESDFARFSDLEDLDFDLLPSGAITGGSQPQQPYGGGTLPSKMNTDDDIPF